MKYASDISLRALEPEDLELIYRIENDPTFWRWGLASVPYSRYVLRQYLQTAANDLFADRQVRLVVQRAETALGLVDLTNFEPQHQRAEISLAILPEFQGQHAGEEAIRLLTDYARQLGLHQLYALVATTNLPAARLFERLGFEADALLKDWIRQDGRWLDVRLFRQAL